MKTLYGGSFCSQKIKISSFLKIEKELGLSADPTTNKPTAMIGAQPSSLMAKIEFILQQTSKYNHFEALFFHKFDA